ncbi:AfsR/SARP family transcriptional regulator [Streptomonospora litoralis]|uniref:Regulatory protein AfsR n=1 Tax=Streptomonospora litoralis TaxID=2498135 RepID=A0A4P6Q3W9_9ACTN|nr:bacterial transcriptional activator domain-containing protein [Streptomonospora litoralis]QBI54920.1 Regulatory protein AfsR [Streptomonospora litoralis]
MSTDDLRINLTGLVTIECSNRRARSLTSPQAQVAFARLVMERAQGTNREQLADTIWPEGLPNTWPSALRSIVSRVRGFLADTAPSGAVGSLVSQGGRYFLRLPAEVRVDLEHAESAVTEAAEAFARSDHRAACRLAERAASCLEGAFLAAHDGDWVIGVRERVDALRLAALEIASLASSALSDRYRALRYANTAIRHAPFRESAHRCRIAALASAGNRAEALGAYHELRELLAEQLGVDPAPEVQRMYIDLLRSPEDSGHDWDPGRGPGHSASHVPRPQNV